MTEKIAFEVRPKKGKKLQKVIFLKNVFWPLCPLWGQKKLYHTKFKGKISYLGEKISILPWQMAEQLAVEVDVKNRDMDVKNPDEEEEGEEGGGQAQI